MMPRTRVKICGITRPEDALLAIKSGADAIGLVFYPGSPRYVTAHQAKAIIDVLPPFVTIVGLFVNCDMNDLKQTLEIAPIDLIQFHGDESKSECEQYNMPYMKALRIPDEMTTQQIINEVDQFSSAKAVLLDSYQQGVPGGTGQVFDWQKIPTQLSVPLVLAGGLTTDNVFSAVQTVRPYAVDVSGGVEKSKGIKDPEKMNVFINEVFHANQK